MNDYGMISGIIVGVLTGAISSTIAALLFYYFQDRKKEYCYLEDVCKYMHDICTMLTIQINDTSMFYTKFYNRPMSHGKNKHYKSADVSEAMNVYNELNGHIECAYKNYILSKDKNNRIAMEKYRKEISDLKNQYNMSANKLGQFLYG